MKWIVRAEWISYDRTNIHNGVVATELDSSKAIADHTVDTWLVEASTKEEAIKRVGTPWEVSPTIIYATTPEPPIRDDCIFVGTQRSHYWRYKPQTKKQRTEQIQNAAQQLLRRSEWGPEQPVDLRKLAPILAESNNCHVETAKRHLTKAARILRGKTVAKRGGKRDGAGRPPSAPQR